MNNERIVLVDLDECDEIEYRGYYVSRIRPQTYFFKIDAVDEDTSSPDGVWTSAKEAIAAIDALLGKGDKVQN